MALMAAMERRTSDVNGWIKANAWHLITTAAHGLDASRPFEVRDGQMTQEAQA